jgi:hypothetical protein
MNSGQHAPPLTPGMLCTGDESGGWEDAGDGSDNDMAAGVGQVHGGPWQCVCFCGGGGSLLNCPEMRPWITGQ